MDRPQAGVADAPARRVDDALEGQGVVGLVDDPKVSDGVADLHALVETRAADDPVGDAELEEAFLELAGLEAGAHQYRHLVEGVLAPLQGFDALGDHPRLGLAVPQARQVKLLAVLALRPQGLAQAPGVLGDEARGGGQDVSGGTVVLFEADDLGAGEILFELQDVADLGPAPAVDRLVVVADAADVGAALGEQAQPQILGHVGVLVLVDQQVLEALVILGEDVVVGGEQGQAVEQQIAEIGGVEGLEPRLVGGVNLQQLAAGEIARVPRIYLVGGQPLVLPALDDGVQEPRRPALGIDILGLEDLLDQADLVVLIEDREIGFKPDQLGMTAQHTGGDGMKRAQDQAFGGAGADQRLDPPAHLAGRLVGEGDGENLRGPGQTQI